MLAEKKTLLEQGGIDIDSALARFMGNEAMLERYLQKFLNEESYSSLRDAVNAQDWETAARAAHTLKSVCGTLGCTRMAELVIRQEQLLRSGEREAASAMMPEITACYDGICSLLRGQE